MLIVSFSSLLMLVVPGVATSTVSAYDQTNINNSLCQGSNIHISTQNNGTGVSECTTDDPGNTLSGKITKAINIASTIVGAAAVIMIIIGGFRYITSAGKQESVQGAKNTLLYAIIGLIIVALAQIIVHFVIQTSTATG